MTPSNKTLATIVRNSTKAQSFPEASPYLERSARVGASALRHKENTKQRVRDEKELNTPFARKYATTTSVKGQRSEQRPLFAIALQSSDRLESILKKTQNTANTFQTQADYMSNLARMDKTEIVELIMDAIMSNDISTARRRELLKDLQWGMSEA